MKIKLTMWEKLTKEEKNNNCQRLREYEEGGKSVHVSVYPVQDAKNMHIKMRNAMMWRVGLLSAWLMFLLILMMCTTHLSKLKSMSYKSLWRTSAHLQVYTYTHLARLAPPHIDAQQSDKVVSCYYNLPNDSETNQLMPDKIQPQLCTHINVAFARIVNKKIWLDDNQYKSLRDVVKLKQHNPNLKILLSVGGSGNDKGFSEMVVDHASRKKFIRSIKKILSNYTLDGIDLDWEFPALHKLEAGGRERQHFSQLLREIRMEYIREKRNYILTIAAPAPETIVNISYDIDQVNQYVDYVNIMTYDYHFYSKYTPFTGYNSPLYARASEQMYLATLNINYTVHMYIDKGLDRNKIVVGIPTYGHTFMLVNPNNHEPGSPASGFGKLGGGGFANYPDVCNFVQNFNDVTLKHDSEAKVYYLFRDKEWVSYDTPHSVIEKAKFIKDNNLRGAMIYSLNADDYEGICNSELGSTTKFPLSLSVKNTLVFNGTDAFESNKLTD